MSSFAREDSVASLIAEFFRYRGLRFVHQLSGGMIAFLADAFVRHGVELVNYRHEQSAGFAAEGESRVLNRPSLALATSGPGATNLLTAIASCYFDSSPVIFITGQVNSREIKRNLEQRQNGFQELDIVNLCQSITKLAVRVESSSDIPKLLESAWKIALSDRKGPVLIDIPIDIQQQVSAGYDSWISRKSLPPRNVTQGRKFLSPSRNNKLPRRVFRLERIANLLNAAKKPLILVGGGVRLDESVEEFRQFAAKTNLPVVSSLMGLDAPNHETSNYVGFIGSYGNRWANRALYQSDVLLVLGSRLDIRQTGGFVNDFTSGKRIIRVDIDQWELKGRIRAEFNFQMRIKDFIGALDSENLISSEATEFLEEISGWRTMCESLDRQLVNYGVDPVTALNEISAFSNDSNGYFVDVGQHQMWAAQSLKLNAHQRFITSGGLGSMGFAIPSSIGATTTTGKRWIAITGDGCAQLSISELQTIKQYNLPITVYVFNNQQHGMVAQFQEEYLDSNFVGTRIGYSSPNFTSVASAFGLRAIRVSTFKELEEAHSKILHAKFEPNIIEVMISQEYKALPKLGNETRLKDM